MALPSTSILASLSTLTLTGEPRARATRLPTSTFDQWRFGAKVMAGLFLVLTALVVGLIAREIGVNPGFAAAFVGLNPLMLWQYPGDGHNDTIMMAFGMLAVLFVVRAGVTDYEAAKKGSMEFREKNLLGVVLNQVENSEGQGGYYYGHSDKK